MTLGSIQHMVESDYFLLGWMEESGWVPSFPWGEHCWKHLYYFCTKCCWSPPQADLHPVKQDLTCELPYTYKVALWKNFFCTLGWSEMLNLNDAALASSYNKPSSQLLVIWVIFHLNMGFTSKLNLLGSQHPAINFWIATLKSSCQVTLVFPVF